jgi:hypothetical protein
MSTNGFDAAMDPAMDAEGILRAGEERAGRAADPKQPWIAALQVLVGSATQEGGLSAPGRAAFAGTLVELVDERLRAEGLLEAHAEIGERPLPVRFAVAGMGRSGTTLTHRLLSCDPDVAFTPTWQAMRPVPAGRTPPADDPRRLAIRRFIDELAAVNPEALRIHPLDADAPEEEVFLLQHSFATMLFGLNCPLPTYDAWLAESDNLGAYEFAFDLVRLNEWAADAPSGRPRVMKSPQFLLDLNAVLRAAPDAVVALTHRDPGDLAGSYCSTYANSRRRSVAEFDPVQLGRERLEQLQLMANRAVDVSERAQPGRIVDVYYADLVRDPMSVIEMLYAAAEVALSDAARRAMHAWLDAHPQHQGGRHDYDLADYGLDRAGVESALARYIERFQVLERR